MSWQGFQIFKHVTRSDDLEDYWRFEGFVWILFGFLGAAVATVCGAGYVGYRLWNEITLEISYKQRYGVNWKTEFEHYHGSLAHVHLRLAIAFFCLFALLLILSWTGRRYFRKRKRIRRNQIT